MPAWSMYVVPLLALLGVLFVAGDILRTPPLPRVRLDAQLRARLVPERPDLPPRQHPHPHIATGRRRGRDVPLRPRAVPRRRAHVPGARQLGREPSHGRRRCSAVLSRPATPAPPCATPGSSRCSCSTPSSSTPSSPSSSRRSGPRSSSSSSSARSSVRRPLPAAVLLWLSVSSHPLIGTLAVVAYGVVGARPASGALPAAG